MSPTDTQKVARPKNYDEIKRSPRRGIYDSTRSNRSREMLDRSSISRHQESERADMRILFADKDPTIARKVASILQTCIVDNVPTGADVVEELSAGRECDVLVVAWDIHNMTAIQLLTEIEEKGLSVPTIVLIDDDCLLYEETALALGAADVILKSRGTRILSQRILLVTDGIRKIQSVQEEDEEHTYGPLVLRPESCRAFWHDSQVSLTLTEYNIVALMVQNSPRCQSYREIYDVVHGKGFAAGDGIDGFRLNVRTLIKRIRKKFCAIDANFDRIETCPGAGYRWRNVSD